MNKITLIYPYYKTAAVIPELVKNWNSWDAQVKQHVTVIVVDDGSPQSFYSIYKDLACDLKIELYEILQDIPWNQPGAMNLGISRATTDWIMTMNVDRMLPNDTMLAMINANLNRNCYYALKDICEGKHIGSPPGIMLLTKEAVVSSGMYDEDFSGNYGHDDLLLKKHLERNYKYRLTDWYMHVLPHASHEHGLVRSTEVNKKLMQDKLSGKIPVSRDCIRFKWRKVFS